MVYPTIVSADLANYTGRAVQSYPAYTIEAIKQATLLFKIATCIEDWPEDPNDSDLALYAILAMADSLVLAQPHQEVLSGPFQSETQGSYSYSIGKSVATTISSGSPTGVSWFDLAVEHLGVCQTGAGVYSGSIDVFSDDLLVVGDPVGQRKALGPKDYDRLYKRGIGPNYIGRG